MGSMNVEPQYKLVELIRQIQCSMPYTLHPPPPLLAGDWKFYLLERVQLKCFICSRLIQKVIDYVDSLFCNLMRWNLRTP